MKRDVVIYLWDIITSIAQARDFIATMSYEEFKADRKTSYAVVRCLEIIGEASKNVPEGIRGLRPSVPWKLLAGMRDKCIHAYFGVKFRTVWETVQHEIPRIEPLIVSLYEDLRRTKKSTDIPPAPDRSGAIR
jgi:uncharacterized protein with HEPN domain